MKFRLPIVVISLLLCSSSCVLSDEPCPGDKPTEENTIMSKLSIDLQGHRGCRGLRPENTWPGFQHAIDLGVSTLELDVIITGDQHFVVSHEPWVNGDICDGPGEGGDEKALNMFRMSAQEIAQISCGTKPYANFPEQQLVQTHKPLLTDLVQKVLVYCEQHRKPVPNINVEIKSRLEWEGTFHPDPETYVSHFLETFKLIDYPSRFIVQSFDLRVLRALKDRAPEIELAYLTFDAEDSPKKAIERLGFTPAIYSPDMLLVTAGTREACTQLGIELVVWTVNEPADIERMVALGVDGIISDYPNRVLDYAATIGLQIQ